MSTYLYFRTYWGKQSQTGLSGRNILATSKMQLVETCINALELDGVKIHTCACVDYSTPEYTAFLKSRFDDVFHTSEGCDVIDHKGRWPVFGGIGNLPRVLSYIAEQHHASDDVVLIVEDDYLFVERGLGVWISACEQLDGFVSPFDHPDRYVRNDDLYGSKADIKIVDNRHWRTIESNTSVVGGRYEYFARTAFTRKVPRLYVLYVWPGHFLGRELPSIDRVFYRRAYLWNRVKLYSPIPGLATHLSRFIPPPSRKNLKKGATLPATHLSPGVDWEKRFRDLQPTSTRDSHSAQGTPGESS